MDDKEIDLYGMESKATCKKEMAGVDFMSKDKAKIVLKDVVRLIKTCCEDDDIVKDVFKIAGKTMVASDQHGSMHHSGTNFNLSNSTWGSSGVSFGSNYSDDSSISLSSDSSSGSYDD